jgi:Protein of unknown function (DUF3780)
MSNIEASYTGFGGLGQGTHRFLVKIPPLRTAAIEITEEYGYFNGRPDDALRVKLPRPLWAQLAEVSRKDFNPRLRIRKVPAGAWKGTEVYLDRMLGRELCVLAWAAEPATVEQLTTICAKWLALRPEERWWLFSTTAAEAGLAEDGQRGWRKALYLALSDAEPLKPERQISRRRNLFDEDDRRGLFA